MFLFDQLYNKGLSEYEYNTVLNYLYGDKNYIKYCFKNVEQIVINYEEYKTLKCDYCKKIDINHSPKLIYQENVLMQICKQCEKGIYKTKRNMLLIFIGLIAVLKLLDLIIFTK